MGAVRPTFFRGPAVSTFLLCRHLSKLVRRKIIIMKLSRQKSGGSKLNSLSEDAPVMSNTCSYLSQIYLEQ